jgi:hypothetical protein
LDAIWANKEFMIPPFQPMTGDKDVCLTSKLCKEAQMKDRGPGQPRHKVRPNLKNNQHKKDW